MIGALIVRARAAPALMRTSDGAHRAAGHRYPSTVPGPFQGRPARSEELRPEDECQ